VVNAGFGGLGVGRIGAGVASAVEDKGHVCDGRGFLRLSWNLENAFEATGVGGAAVNAFESKIPEYIYDVVIGAGGRVNRVDEFYGGGLVEWNVALEIDVVVLAVGDVHETFDGHEFGFECVGFFV